MKRFHVQETDLAVPTANASVRALIAYEAGRARDLLNEGAPWWVASTAGFRGCSWRASWRVGGRRSSAIAAADHDVLPGPPKSGKVLLLREAGVVLRGEG